MEYLRDFIAACETFGWTGGPQFDTRIVTLANGRERRNANWAQYQNRYTLPFQNIDADAYRDIRQMFEVCRGQAGAFLYSDPLANFADDQLIGYADGREYYQLATLSVRAGVTYQRAVFAVPDDGDVVVTVDGTPFSDFDLDYDRGRIYPNSPIGDAAELRWTGPFAVWVRFANDWLPFSIDSRNSETFAHNGSVDLLEVSAPPDNGTS